jgi:hypothetical protein
MTDVPLAVPTVTAYFNPVLAALRALGGGASNAEIDARVASELGLSPEQLGLPHKPEDLTRSEHAYRTAWARTYLKKVDLLTNPRRGFWALTPLGASTATVSPEEVAGRVRAQLLTDDADAEVAQDADASAEPLVAGVRLDPRLASGLRGVGQPSAGRGPRRGPYARYGHAARFNVRSRRNRGQSEATSRTWSTRAARVGGPRSASSRSASLAVSGSRRPGS